MALNSRLALTLITALAACSAAGCEVTKSANPLSPTVAGPIAGVVISKPNALEPGMDWQIFMRDQPIKLLFQNTNTSGERALTYTVEIATDDQFASVIFKRSGIAPGSGSTTSLQLPDALPTGRLYWWHVRAEDGANIGDYSTSVRFSTVTPVVLGALNLNEPTGTIDTTVPVFKISAGGRSGPTGRVVYQVQVANDQAFTSIAATFLVDETLPQTTIAQNYQFLPRHDYYWRAQAKDTGDSQAVSPWSGTQHFYADPPAPTAPKGGSGGGPVGNGNWQSCGSTPGYDLVQCVRDAVYVTSTEDNAFQITKRVAWLLRGQGAGLLIKNGGENIISWQGYSFSISRIVYSNGALIKVISDAGNGGGNGAAWDTSLFYAGAVDPALYVAPINPDLP